MLVKFICIHTWMTIYTANYNIFIVRPNYFNKYGFKAFTLVHFQVISYLRYSILFNVQQHSTISTPCRALLNFIIWCSIFDKAFWFLVIRDANIPIASKSVFTLT